MYVDHPQFCLRMSAQRCPLACGSFWTLLASSANSHGPECHRDDEIWQNSHGSECMRWLSWQLKEAGPFDPTAGEQNTSKVETGREVFTRRLWGEEEATSHP